MREDFERAVEFTLRWEGGYTVDSGGETKYGISKRAYPELDIRNLTLMQAKEIYHKDYWNRINGDFLSSPLAIVAFDTAVNMGVGVALRLLSKTRDWVEFIFLRIESYATLKNFKEYGRGWIRRCVDLYRFARELERERRR